MENIRSVDFAALRASAERHTQRLLDRASGATSCQITVVKTPPASGSPEGLHTHEVDQIFYVLEGTMSIEVQGATREAGPGSLVVFPAGLARRRSTPSAAPMTRSSPGQGARGSADR